MTLSTRQFAEEVQNGLNNALPNHCRKYLSWIMEIGKGVDRSIESTRYIAEIVPTNNCSVGFEQAFDLRLKPQNDCHGNTFVLCGFWWSIKNGLHVNVHGNNTDNFADCKTEEDLQKQVLKILKEPQNDSILYSVKRMG